MREKFGGVEDATVDDDEEEEEEHRTVWGGRKDLYYRADNIDIEVSICIQELLSQLLLEYSI